MTWKKEVNPVVELLPFKVRIHKGGRDNLYSQLRLPRQLADKYSMNQECEVEIIDREDLGGILIRKSS